MKLIEILKNGKKILVGEGYDDEITSPVEIRIVIDEKVLSNIETTANYFKWELYDAIKEMLHHPLEITEEAEATNQGIINTSRN